VAQSLEIEMQTQRSTLLDKLPEHGWDVVLIEEVNLEWWADEMWTLDSFWSPVGSRAYLTFLVDPQFSSLFYPQRPRHRKKGEAVWAVAASATMPRERRQAGSTFIFLSLNHGWLDELPSFLKDLSTLRHESQEQTF